MAGKSKVQRKKRAMMQQREKELLAQKQKKILKVAVLGEAKTAMSRMAEQGGEVLGNGAEPPPPNINEDAQKDEVIDFTHDVADEPKPFDPSSVVSNILKKHGA